MKIAISVFIILVIAATSIAYSHSGATGIVKERMDAMKTMSDQSKLVGNMFKGKTEFNRTVIEDAAEVFSQHGLTMKGLFPDTKESRNGHKTEALPRIWTEWENFSEKVDEFIALNNELKKTLTTTDNNRDLKKAFFQTAKSCRGCHKRFRKPKK